MISIHQSQFLSWTPFYYKVLSSENFVTLDNVQFQKNGVQNRNLIKTPQGKSWITVPVKYDLSTKINEVIIDPNFKKEKLLRTIELNYKKSENFETVFKIMKSVIESEYFNLHQLNENIFIKFLKLLDSNTKLINSSSMSIISKKDDLVIDIIKNIGDFEYLSGKGALNYMDMSKFKKENIKVYVYDFKYSNYSQLWNKLGFIKELSILDLLFNNLDKAKKYILENGSIKRII